MNQTITNDSTGTPTTPMAATDPTIKQEADDLSKELLAILSKHGVAQALPTHKLTELMVDLSIFTVTRDHKVMAHGMQIGEQNA